MLNSKNERELVYVTLIDNIEPIIGSDNCECAIVGGWHVMVRKGQFNVGDPAIYFEIDSKVPSDKECFAFLEKRNYKVKTQKFTFGGKGNFISQGLLMHAEDFGWEIWENNNHNTNEHEVGIADDKGVIHWADRESRFLTKELDVTYADAEDNQRKAPSVDKYKKMAQRHPNIFKKSWARWLMKREWGRKLMFVFFGKKKDKKNSWPEWVVKTDEERVQNMPWILEDEGEWIITEKIDGSSTTFTMKRGRRKNEFYVCSRNVCFDSVDKPCYYDTNIYWEMAEKYAMFEVLKQLLGYLPEAEWVTIQGETYGAGVQKRDYGLAGHDFAAFNLITSDKGRWNSNAMKNLLENGFNVPCVPVVESSFSFNQLDQLNGETRLDKLLFLAEGESKIDGLPREGFVLRSVDGTKSFKAVSNSFLLRFHS